MAFIPGLPKPTPRHGLTAWIAITDPTCKLTVGLARNEDRYLSLAARAFRHHITAFFDRPQPDALPGLASG